MFKKILKLEGKDFKDRSSLAQYLTKNFRKSVNYLNGETLYLFLKDELPELYNHLIDLTKEYEHKENILTMLIYLLDNNSGIVTSGNQFKTNYDIAEAMKKSYPSINKEIKVLFHDKVLAHIYWNEYQKTLDSRFKRNYTFMLHVYENRMYDFTYYYFLFLHLAKNEVVRFNLDGSKMKSLGEICVHLSKNIDRSSLIIEEILNNPFILALMAVKSGIEVVSTTLSSKSSLEILKLLSTYGNVDLTPIIRRRMAYWLLHNYQNYLYETDEAKVLYNDYVKVSKNLTLSTLSDYIAIFDEVTALYKRFILLFNHNKLVTFRNGINATDEYYLNYRFNEDYVCKKFLTDNKLYDEAIHTEVHRDSVEREVLVDALETEKKEIEAFREEVVTLTADLNFDKKKLSKKLFTSSMYLVLSIVSLVAAFFVGLTDENPLYQMVKYVLVGLLGVAVLFLIIAINKYNKKLNDAELVEVAIENSEYSVKVICKEEEMILNPRYKTYENSTLKNLETFHKNRKMDLSKIKRIASQKGTVSSFFLNAASFLAIIPILEFGLVFVLKLFNVTPYVLDLGLGVSLISLIIAIFHFVMLIVFIKKNTAYYLIYLYFVIVTVLSIFIK